MDKEKEKAYLKRIIIREYKRGKYNIRLNKFFKEKTDYYQWYAVFIFSKKPIKGKMKVIYQ